MKRPMHSNGTLPLSAAADAAARSVHTLSPLEHLVVVFERSRNTVLLTSTQAAI